MLILLLVCNGLTKGGTSHENGKKQVSIEVYQTLTHLKIKYPVGSEAYYNLFPDWKNKK